MGEKARAAVSAVIANAGHAVETISNDYGEDLLVQTSHEQRMDSSRLWFQVKGTEDVPRHRLKSGVYSVAVGFEHALRWARSADLVVVVLWDVLREEGWYAIPGKQIDAWADLTSGTRSNLNLHFSPDNQFTPVAVDRLAWESRINHYRLLLLSARDIEQEEEEGRSELRVAITMDLMQMLGMIEPAREPGKFRLTTYVRTVFLAALFRLEGEYPSNELVPLAALWTVLDQMNEIDSRLGLPRIVAGDMRDVLVALLPPIDFILGSLDAR